MTRRLISQELRAVNDALRRSHWDLMTFAKTSPVSIPGSPLHRSEGRRR